MTQTTLDSFLSPIGPGDRVRSLSFPDSLPDRRFRSFMEGVVERIVRVGETCHVHIDGPEPKTHEIRFIDCDRVMIRVTRRVCDGDEVDSFPPVIFPPVNGTPRSLGGVTDGIHRI